MTDFKDPKNIPSLFREMDDVEFPQGYDGHFEKKLIQENTSWIGNFFTIPKLGFAAGLASIFAVSLKLIHNRKQNMIATDLEVDDEINMLDDLDILSEWDENEDAK